MTIAKSVNHFLLAALNEESDFYDFHVRQIENHQRTLPPGSKILKSYNKMIQIGSDLSETGHLSNLLFATNDEKKTELANDYSEFLLFRVDSREPNYFRIGVNRREVSGDIDYSLQRDHQVHTLYNYLLGWAFYQYTDLREAMDQTISHVKEKTVHLRHEINTNFFGNMWHYVSLFHDIGYLFQGQLPGNSIDFNNDSLTRGATWVHNYFLHRFWFDAEIDSISIRKILYKYLDINAIDFDRIKSMIALGDIITSLYNINEIKQSVDRKNPGFFSEEYRDKNFNYWDAFKIWEIFYENCFTNTHQLDRIKQLKKAYYDGMFKGTDGYGARTIDHGVASGLLMLLSSSYFYSIYFNLQNINAQDESQDFRISDDTRNQWLSVFRDEGKYHVNPDKAFKDEMVVFERIGDYILDYKYPHYDYRAEWFFTGVLWATSASAVHNIQQENPSKWFNEVRPNETAGRLWIEDDPLAYLGILVDIIQTWDRFNVNRNPYFEKRIPIQSRDVLVKQTDRKLVFTFQNNEKVVKGIKEDLTKSLKDWEKYVQIES